MQKFLKKKKGTDLPDLTKMPDWALINRRTVQAVCSMSPSVLDKRLAANVFPPQIRHGRNLLWRLGDIRLWAQSLEEGDV